MSKNQAPAPRASFMQNLLLMSVFMMLFFVITNAMKPPVESRSAEQLYAAMKEANKNELQATIRNELSPRYLNKIDGLRISEAEKEAKKLEAAILVADAQLKAGIHRNNTSHLTNGYFALDTVRKELKDKPIWTEKVVPVADVTADKQLGWKEWTGQALYDKTVAVLHEKNQKELTWGLFPGYQMMSALVNATGAVPGFSYWFAALLLAIIVRAIVFPISHKQMMFSRQMSQLQPLVAELREKYKTDLPTQQAKMMELYKEYGINPAAGCIPVLLQMPLFILVYQFMLHYRFEFQKGYFAWISPWGHSITPFFAPNLGELDYLLITLYGISMVVSTMLMPVTDPSNIKQQRMMGIGIALLFSISMFFYPLPSAFVLYWTFANVFATAQSLWAYRLPLPPLVKVNTPTGGVYPTNGTATSDPLAGLKTNVQVKTGKPVQHKPKKRK